ncbi:pyruvate formate lyase family protein [Chloroflexota bacterium]
MTTSATKKAEVQTKEPPVIEGRINAEPINRTNGFTPRVQASRKRYMEVVSKVSSDRVWYMIQSYKETEGQHPYIRRAKALANIWDNMAIDVFDYDLLIGNWTDAVRGAHMRMEFHFDQMKRLLLANEAAWTNSETQQALLSQQDSERLLEGAEYWATHFPDPETQERWDRIFSEHDPDDWAGDLSYTGVVMRMERNPKDKRFKMSGTKRVNHEHGYAQITNIQAAGANYGKILKVGYRGYLNEARQEIEKVKEVARGRDFTDDEKEKLAFCESAIIVTEAMIRHANRFADIAEEKAKMEKDPQRKKELLKAAETCRWVPENGARTFQEALQSVWFHILGIHMDKAMPNVFLGRFDQYTFPYYKADINEGRITRQEAAELIGCFIMKMAELEPYLTPEHRAFIQGTNYENCTLGGVDIHNRDASNEISCLFLHVAKDLKMHQPYISLRYNPKMAPELLDKAFECARVHGAGIPAFFSDLVNIPYMLGRGHTIEHARDYAIAGCINAVYPNSFGWVRGNIGFNNLAKIVELILHNGVDPRTGIKIGLETGDSRNMTFDELLEAWKKNVSYLINKQIDMFEVWDREGTTTKDTWPYPFISTFLDGCLQNGKDVTRYGNSPLIDDAHYGLDRCIQDASDSLMAIKKLVFEQKKYTMGEIIKACDANFEGYDKIRADCLAQPKYGNDDDEADELMNELWCYSRDLYLARKDYLGRRYIVYRQGSAVAHQAGKWTGALPNGRVAGVSLADASLSPMQGMDLKGPTAVINSVAKIDTTDMDGTLLNMKLCPSLVDKPGGMMKFKQMVKTFMEKGGQEIQFNILDKDMLLDAQKHPEQHRDLVVRVAGYSAFWVDLEKQVQDEIISRTEHEM